MPKVPSKIVKNSKAVDRQTVLSEIPILTMQFENKILKILCPMKFEILFHSYFFLTIELQERIIVHLDWCFVVNPGVAGADEGAGVDNVEHEVPLLHRPLLHRNLSQLM